MEDGPVIYAQVLMHLAYQSVTPLSMQKVGAMMMMMMMKPDLEEDQSGL
jgi:hypothetical protein